VYNPTVEGKEVRWAWAERKQEVNMQVDPLPFVPDTWIMSNWVSCS